VTSPAGVQDMDLDGLTVRSALSEVRLGEIVAEGSAVDAPIGDLRLVPILRLGPGDSYPDPVPSDLAGRAAYRDTPALSTRNIGDYYLGDAELTRAEYWGIVMAALARDPGVAGKGAELVHAADPLGRARLELEGMRPVIYEESSEWAELLAQQPERPVTGVNFFQAYSAARMAGWLICGDPNLLRLPLGVELEFAAMGSPGSERSALNGAAVSGAPGSGFSMRAFLAMSESMDDRSVWPMTKSESLAAGDALDTALGSTLIGLDFGVREWVLDLPYAESARILFSDHEQFLQVLTQFAASGGGVPEPLRAVSTVNGVVRGLASGEIRGLVDGLRGALVDRSAQTVPASVPGVVRTLVLRRDGNSVMADQLDPHLSYTGMRLAGDRVLIERVRRR
jgi:hypothetical protein